MCVSEFFSTTTEVSNEVTMSNSRFDAKMLRFCPACGEQHGKHQDGLCKSCRKGAEEILKQSFSVAYCRKCKKFRAPDERKDGLLVRNIVTAMLTVLVYDDTFTGCPECADEMTSDHPHPVLVRFNILTTPDVA